MGQQSSSSSSSSSAAPESSAESTPPPLASSLTPPPPPRFSPVGDDGPRYHKPYDADAIRLLSLEVNKSTDTPKSFDASLDFLDPYAGGSRGGSSMIASSSTVPMTLPVDPRTVAVRFPQRVNALNGVYTHTALVDPTTTGHSTNVSEEERFLVIMRGTCFFVLKVVVTGEEDDITGRCKATFHSLCCRSQPLQAPRHNLRETRPLLRVRPVFGKYFAAAGPVVELWNPEKGEMIARRPPETTFGFFDVCQVPRAGGGGGGGGGHLLAYAGFDDFYVYDVGRGELDLVATLFHAGNTVEMCSVPEAGVFFTTNRKTLRFWDSRQSELRCVPSTTYANHSRLRPEPVQEIACGNMARVSFVDVPDTPCFVSSVPERVHHDMRFRQVNMFDLRKLRENASVKTAKEVASWQLCNSSEDERAISKVHAIGSHLVIESRAQGLGVCKVAYSVESTIAATAVNEIDHSDENSMIQMSEYREFVGVFCGGHSPMTEYEMEVFELKLEYLCSVVLRDRIETRDSSLLVSKGFILARQGNE